MGGVVRAIPLGTRVWVLCGALPQKDKDKTTLACSSGKRGVLSLKGGLGGKMGRCRGKPRSNGRRDALGSLAGQRRVACRHVLSWKGNKRLTFSVMGSARTVSTSGHRACSARGSLAGSTGAKKLRTDFNAKSAS